MRKRNRKTPPPVSPVAPTQTPAAAEELGAGDPNEIVSTMTITLSRSGRLDVNGPIGNKIRAYGMLQTAIEVVRDYVPK